jgi:hypothetical protein
VDAADAKIGLVRFRFNGEDAGLAELLAGLLAGGHKAVTFREVPLSLEDAFMALSGMSTEVLAEEEQAGEAALQAGKGPRA